MEFFQETVKRFGYLFYMMDPRAHNYEKVEDVKDYYKEVIGLFLITALIEQFILLHQDKPMWRITEIISNVCHGFLMQLSRIPFKGAEVWAYAWVYSNYRILELPWDSPWTWLICWLISDFCFYWMHRITHQVNILWAIHETHHTPEDMTLTSPMRNHIFLLPIHWVTYVPMALAIPPTSYLVHYQITVIYQYWLHSEIIHKLPAPVEYLFSTPSNHRAHHGRNRRYIDKNFGGFLIIWDRIFGTYEAEDPDEKPLYGITTQMKSFNPLIIQTRPFMMIWKKFLDNEGFVNKLSAIFKGPGWYSGKSWLGNVEDIPEPAPHFEKYNPKMPLWCKLYTIVHFFFVLIIYMFFFHNMMQLTSTTVKATASFIACSCICFGFLLDNSRSGPLCEFLRCTAFFIIDNIVYSEVLRYGSFAVFILFAIRSLFVVSVFFWITFFFYGRFRKRNKEKL